MLDGRQETRDWMSICGCSEILRSDVQIDLCTRDEPMAEQIADGDEADAGTHEVRGERVPQSMRRDDLRDPRATRVSSHTFVDRAARDRSVLATDEERRGGQRGAAHAGVELQPF